jgi:two-component system, chemotaxis family, protein-glutamate methylesterase/glutaminase
MTRRTSEASRASVTNRLRVLVVEDSLTVRRHLCDVLGADPDLEVVGEAEDGKRAIELCAQLRPDVITLDMMLPVMSGLAATEYIMAHCPTPILIVSSSTNRADLFQTYEALAAGAVDVMEKPPGDAVDKNWERKLISSVKLIARIKVITHPRARLASVSAATPPEREVEWPLLPVATRACRLVALGASTGGPSAILEILHALPAEFPLPVLVVLHIGESFGSAFADWLDSQSSHGVSFARDGQRVDKRGVFLAPSNHHLILRNGRLHLSDGPERHSCRPSVDVLFESLARECGAATVACLLTGMGRDGASGLLQIRQAGGRTIVQDEASCVVYGMPREAVLIGAAERVLPLTEIGPVLAALARDVEVARRA